MRYRKLALVTSVTAVLLVGCGGGAGGSAQDSSTEVESSEPGVVTITAPVNAATLGFAETQVPAKANVPFAIHFDNQDAGIPHNVVIYEGTDTSATPVFTPGTATFVTGPDADDYDIPALAPGTYTFVCASHPTVMTGTLTVA